MKYTIHLLDDDGMTVYQTPSYKTKGQVIAVISILLELPAKNLAEIIDKGSTQLVEIDKDTQYGVIDQIKIL